MIAVNSAVIENVTIQGPGSYNACYFENCAFDTSTGMIETVDCYFSCCWPIPPGLVSVRAIFNDCEPTFWTRLLDEDFQRSIG